MFKVGDKVRVYGHIVSYGGYGRDSFYLRGEICKVTHITDPKDEICVKVLNVNDSVCKGLESEVHPKQCRRYYARKNKKSRKRC